jgi:hypothetical protein
MKYVFRFVVGMVVLYILLAIFMLDPGQALLLIAISVICTAGISLVIWIPLAYFVGWGVLALFARITGKTIDFDSTTPPAEGEPAQVQSENIAALSQQLNKEPGLTNDQQAIASYIRKALEKGLGHDKIIENLRNNGWSTDSIRWGFDFVAGENVA